MPVAVCASETPTTSKANRVHRMRRGLVTSKVFPWECARMWSPVLSAGWLSSLGRSWGSGSPACSTSGWSSTGAPDVICSPQVSGLRFRVAPCRTIALFKRSNQVAITEMPNCKWLSWLRTPDYRDLPEVSTRRDFKLALVTDGPRSSVLGNRAKGGRLHRAARSVSRHFYHTPCIFKQPEMRRSGRNCAKEGRMAFQQLPSPDHKLTFESS
jgi:hypothetical protein